MTCPNKHFFIIWRKHLDKDGDMVTTRKELIRAARELDYMGDPESVWRAMNEDDRGFSPFDDWAPREARTLGLVKQWIKRDFEGQPKSMHRAVHEAGQSSVKKSIDRDCWKAGCE